MGSIKECLESYGFQGRLGTRRSEPFLSLPSGKKMIQRFKLEWSTKISNSDRLATYLLFKSVPPGRKRILMTSQ